MEIDCGINLFSAELNGSLGVDYWHLGQFSNYANHCFGNTICMVGVWRTPLHQQIIITSGQNGSGRVEAVRQSRQGHPGAR